MTMTQTAVDFTDQRVLVTGGAGFVGSNLVALLLHSRAAHVHIVDNLVSSVRANIPQHSRIRFTEGSIADDAVLENG